MCSFPRAAWKAIAATAWVTHSLLARMQEAAAGEFAPISP